MLPRPTRATVCVSTQIGCGVGCTFCATGKMGWQRNLCTTEILEQVLLARQRVGDWSSSQKRNIHLRNVVFMGMGEPLHNDGELFRSLEWLISDKGFGFSPRHLTVSTAGVPGKMIELAQRFPRVRIALSLHAAEPELRRQLVPRATHDLESLRGAIRRINAIDPLGPVWIEIALIAGINDSREHAHAIHRFCEGLRVEINVIPYNDTSHASGLTAEETEVFQAPTRETVRDFVEVLRGLGWYTTWRNTYGDSIRAACGQLATGLTTQSSVS
jgi:23S rRNA (adenine2503-C2)-methyltransferase